MRPGNEFSYDCSTVVEIDGRIAGLVGLVPSRGRWKRLLKSGVHSFDFYGLTRGLQLGWRARQMAAATPHAPRSDAYVPDLAVHPDFRRQGIGMALLDEAHRQARAAGDTWCSLHVLIENEVAQRLYLRAGYSEVERKQNASLRRQAGVSGLILMRRAL